MSSFNLPVNFKEFSIYFAGTNQILSKKIKDLQIIEGEPLKLYFLLNNNE
jgi:hypothetical protein